MVASISSATLNGVEGRPVRVEAHVSGGLPCFSIVGLPDVACRESRDRVRAAVHSAGGTFPSSKVIINLAPTDLRKTGSGLDLAIAIAVMVDSGQIPGAAVESFGFVAELGLDGTLRPIPGVLCLLDALGDVVPVVAPGNLDEARLVRDDAVSARSLADLVGILAGDDVWSTPVQLGAPAPVPQRREPDLAEVAGQPVGRLALELAAAGGHHLLMTGPPGAGKTMLAERLVSLLPDLTAAESAQVSRIHSAARELSPEAGFAVRPPMRAPHHTASAVALVGGGSGAIRPGEVSMASCGVLFLDELGEFPAAHLDALRQPLESGHIVVARANISVMLPAGFLLVAATNPCPCGVLGWGPCSCSHAQLDRYRRRLSGPLLDRFDLSIRVDPPDPARVFAAGVLGESSSTVRHRVAAARDRAQRRGIRTNRELRGAALERHAPLTDAGVSLLRDCMARGLLSMRGAQRVRAVALTLADLAGIEVPLDVDLLSAAIDLRIEQRAGRVVA